MLVCGEPRASFSHETSEPALNNANRASRNRRVEHELELDLTAAYMSLPVHSVEMVLGVRAGFELQLGGASQSRRSVQVTLPTHTAFAVAAQVVPLEHAAAVEECDAVLRVSRKTVAP